MRSVRRPSVDERSSRRVAVKPARDTPELAQETAAPSHLLRLRQALGNAGFARLLAGATQGGAIRRAQPARSKPRRPRTRPRPKPAAQPVALHEESELEEPEAIPETDVGPTLALLREPIAGNGVVHRFFSRALSVLQLNVLPGPRTTHTAAEIVDMTLNAFHQFAQEQVDWFDTPDISNQQRWQLRGLLTFANRLGILSGCGEMKVRDLLATNVVSAGGVINPAVATPLEDYSKGVSQDIHTVELQTPAADPTTALKWGTAVGKLQRAPGLGGPRLKHSMHQVRFEELVNRNFVDDFINYLLVCAPRIEAEKSDTRHDDISSYINLRNEAQDPVDYVATVLNNHIVNFHRFHRQTLDTLEAHFTDRDKPNAARKPLTLILHSAKDHNGAFHRDNHLVTVVTNTNINTLMIEGKETLADVSGELRPLAEAYGKDNKIDQLMIAGHGDARAIELGASEDVDLDSNAAASNALFDEILRNMASDPRLAPHRRIVFNACLTNSNSVPMPLNAGDRTAAQMQVRDHIGNNSSLATYLQGRARAQGLHSIDVRGSNGSFGTVELIDAADGLDIISHLDLSLTADKAEYVRTGTEPQGVLRAVLECWSGFNQPDPEQARKDTLKSMEDRIGVAPTDYKEAIIHTLFDIIVKRYRENGDMIRLFAEVAYRMSKLRLEGEECRADSLVAAGLGPAGDTAAEADAVFKGVLPHMSGLDTAKLVMFEVWMRHESARRADFMSALTAYDCQSASDFVDVAFVTPALAHLLPDTASPTHAQLLLAFRVIDTDETQAEARAFLLKAVGPGNRRFPAALGVDVILAGRPSQQVILQKLGLAAGGSGLAPPPADDLANLDLDGDGTNETYVEPLPGVRGTANVRGAPTYSRPDTASARVRNLWITQRLYLVGQTGDFYAIHNPWVPRDVIFVEKANVRQD